MLVGGAMSGTKIGGVIRIHAVGNEFETEFLAQSVHLVEELGLAVVTAIRGVRAVLGIVHLVGVHEAMGQIEAGNDVFCDEPMALGIGGRNRGHRQRVLAERSMCSPGQVARIDSPRERHHHALRRGEPRQQSGFLFAQRWGDLATRLRRVESLIVVGGGGHAASLRRHSPTVKRESGSARIIRAVEPRRTLGAPGIDTGGNMEKLRVGLLFGGRSVEHDVSINSAASILASLDRTRYEVSLVGVDAEGGWHLIDARALEAAHSADVSGPIEGAVLARVLNEPGVFLPATSGPTALRPDQSSAPPTGAERLDVVFPIIHGRGGEDGALQGLLESAGVPYVGSGILSSALQMDKDFAKRVLAHAGLPVTPWITFLGGELDRDGVPAAAERAEIEIGFPAFVKPANSGSSIGISRVENLAELTAGIHDARRYDRKVIVEASVDAREVEVAVLGNDEPQASVVGEIRVTHAFYDYDAKYRDGSTELMIPADLDEDLSDTLRECALEAYRALAAEGMARVDFLLERNSNRFFVNELNSLPGFTSESSMYPKLWEATGLTYPRLLDRLIELAIERHAHHAKLETHSPPPLVRGGEG